MIKRSKWGNKKVSYWCDYLNEQVTFDSKLELYHWKKLVERYNKGEITNLRRQVTYKCIVNGVFICNYIADYVFEEDGIEVISDAKGIKIVPYGFKKKLVKALFGKVIREYTKED